MDVDVKKHLRSKYTIAIITLIIPWLVLPSFTTKVLWLVLAAGIGFLVGFLSKDDQIHVDMELDFKSLLQKIEDGKLLELDGKKKDESKFSKPVQKALNYFVERLTKAFISQWYANLNKSGSKEFEKCIYSVIMQASHNLVKYAGIRILDVTTLITFGFTNAFIVHVREYRRFEESKLSVEQFLKLPEIMESSKYEFGNVSSEVVYLQNHASLLLDRLLPKAESGSILVHSLLKEIVASQILWNIVQVLKSLI